jgi:CNT family concentrative nucleoside transporter
MDVIRPCFALVFFYFIAWLLSENKKRFSVKILLAGIFWQFIIAALLIYTPSVTSFFNMIAQGLNSVSQSTTKALKFCFGELGTPDSSVGFILAIHAFPILIVISAIASLLMHWGILQFIIKIFSVFFRKTLFIGGTLGVGISTNMFTGQSETPLIVKPYLKKLTRSELFSLITCGTSGIASSVMVLYTVIIGDLIKDSMQHVLSSVLIGIPAALTVARIIIPETETTLTESKDISLKKANNTLDAIFIGIMDGAQVMITIIAMFIGFISLIDILDNILGNIEIGGSPLKLQSLLGFVFAPIAWIIGIPWSEAGDAGSLLGIKFITNELVAYQEFARIGSTLSENSKIIIMYGLCGFANISSVGIVLGVYNALVPERRTEISGFAFKAVIAGTMTNCMTAAVVGLLYKC